MARDHAVQPADRPRQVQPSFCWRRRRRCCAVPAVKPGSAHHKKLVAAGMSPPCRTCTEAAAQARAALRRLREAVAAGEAGAVPQPLRLTVRLPLPSPSRQDDSLQNDDDTDWPGGIQQRFRRLRPLVEDQLLSGYDPEASSCCFRMLPVGWCWVPTGFACVLTFPNGPNMHALHLPHIAHWPYLSCCRSGPAAVCGHAGKRGRWHWGVEGGRRQHHGRHPGATPPVRLSLQPASCHIACHVA